MELYDTNHDGVIKGEELKQTPGLMASLKVMDTDKTQGVTRDQIAARLKKWQDSMIERLTICCGIYRNGVPLRGANVKFVPEKFLEADIKMIGEGKTNESGLAMITLPVTRGSDGYGPGMMPGMYRVEITKEGEDIPAKYNTATEIGQELSVDNAELQRLLKYDLHYGFEDNKEAFHAFQSFSVDRLLGCFLDMLFRL
jgi:hypothetical protein